MKLLSLVLSCLLLFSTCGTLEKREPITFEVSSVKTNTVVFGTNYDGTSKGVYKASGTIKNLSGKALDSYSLDIDYIIYNAQGQSSSLNEGNPKLMFINGFKDRSKPWCAGCDMKFKIEDGIFDTDILFPVSKVEVVYIVRASDPFGFETYQHIQIYDITEPWLTVQKRIIKRGK